MLLPPPHISSSLPRTHHHPLSLSRTNRVGRGTDGVGRVAAAAAAQIIVVVRGNGGARRRDHHIPPTAFLNVSALIFDSNNQPWENFFFERIGNAVKVTSGKQASTP